MHSHKQPNSVQTSLRILLVALVGILFLVVSQQPVAADDGAPLQAQVSVSSTTLLNSPAVRPESTEAMVCDGTPISIMPLGDSITLGTGSGDEPAVALYNVGYRRPLYLSLVEAGYYVDFVGSLENGEASSGPEFDYDHQGSGGKTADYVAANVALHLGQNPADVILLHIGTNDILQDQGPDVSDVTAILDNVESVSPDTIVVVALIIDQVPASPEVVTFNSNLQTMVQNRIAGGDNDLILVDQYSALDYSTDMFDYIHPNDAGYQKMADVWLAALDDVLLGCPQITSDPVTTAQSDQLYTYDVDSLGVPDPTYSLATAPPGMAIDGTTGVISWTPFETQLGAHWVTVRATNAHGSDDQTFRVTVTAQAVCVAEAPISYWQMDELVSGTTALDSILANDATCSGAACPQVVDGMVAQAFDFEGNDELNVPYDSTLNWAVRDSVTVQTWVNTSQSCTEQSKVFMAKGGQFADWWLGCSADELGTQSVAAFWLRQSLDEGESVILRGENAINDGQWHHVVAYHDGTANVVRLFVDGRLEAEASVAFNDNVGNQSTLSIGHLRKSYYFDGLLDEVIIHHKALTDEEIRQHYVNGMGGVPYCADAGIAPAFVSAPVTTAAPGRTYTYEAQASGIPAPTYSLLAAPQEMTIDPATGQISWVVDATVGDQVTVTVQASNGIGESAQQSYVIQVGEPTTQEVYIYLPVVTR